MSDNETLLTYMLQTQSRQHMAPYEIWPTKQQVMEEKCSAAETARVFSSFISHSPTYDTDHLHNAANRDAFHVIPTLRSTACTNAICRYHDRPDVTDECAKKQDDSIEPKILVDGRIPSRLTEPNQRSVLFGASVGVQFQKPVAVVRPMPSRASGVSPNNTEHSRPRSSSKSPSSELSQTHQPFCIGDSFSSPNRFPVSVSSEVAVNHRSEFCGSPLELSPSSRRSGAEPSSVFFDAKQEQDRYFAQPPVQFNELDLLTKSNFFYGDLSRSKAKSKLRRSEIGTFLIRFSSDSKFPFALSLKTPNGVTSVRLARNANGFVRLDCDPGQAERMPAFRSVLDFVVSYVRDETGRRPRHSRSIYLDGAGLSETILDLKKPFEESPASLGHLCRRRINALVPLHRSDELVQTLFRIAPRNTQTLVEFLEAYPYRI